MARLRTLVAAVTLVVPLAAPLGCSSGAPSGESVGATSAALTTYGDWADYGDGQCVTGARAFYSAKFGITLSATGVQTTSIGDCAYLGACMYWVSSKVEPDAATWVRYPWGSEMPKLYDLIVYPPTSTNAYGHVASVDHMEGNDPTDITKLYVMDSNYTVSNLKSPSIHTVSRAPYGFYRLKSQLGPFCTPGTSTLRCGDRAAVHDGAASTLYQCDGITAKVVEACADGCVHATSGDDSCTTPPASDAGASDANGGDAAGGGASDAAGGDAVAVADGAAFSDPSTSGDVATGGAGAQAGCDLGARGRGSAGSMALFALGAIAIGSRRARRRAP